MVTIPIKHIMMLAFFLCKEQININKNNTAKSNNKWYIIIIIQYNKIDLFRILLY